MEARQPTLEARLLVAAGTTPSALFSALGSATSLFSLFATSGSLKKRATGLASEGDFYSFQLQLKLSPEADINSIISLFSDALEDEFLKPMLVEVQSVEILYTVVVSR